MYTYRAIKWLFGIIGAQSCRFLPTFNTHFLSFHPEYGWQFLVKVSLGKLSVSKLSAKNTVVGWWVGWAVKSSASSRNCHLELHFSKCVYFFIFYFGLALLRDCSLCWDTPTKPCPKALGLISTAFPGGIRSTICRRCWINWIKNWRLYEPSHHGWTSGLLMHPQNSKAQLFLFWTDIVIIGPTITTIKFYYW